MDAAERIRALHVPHDNGSVDCWPRCEAAHPGVQVCNADDYRWPCPTIQTLSDTAPSEAECSKAAMAALEFGASRVVVRGPAWPA